MYNVSVVTLGKAVTYLATAEPTLVEELLDNIGAITWDSDKEILVVGVNKHYYYKVKKYSGLFNNLGLGWGKVNYQLLKGVVGYNLI